MNIKYIVYQPKYQKEIEELNNLSSEGQLAKYNQTEKNPVLNIKEKYFSKGGCFWLAIDKNNLNKVVGMVAVKVINDKTAKVKTLRVLPNYRHQHIAKNLMMILENFCKEHLFSEIILGVGDDPDSIPAIKFYESIGFIKKNKEEKQPGIWAFNYYKYLE